MTEKKAEPSRGLLFLIALFKLLKATSLLLLAMAAHHLLHHSAADIVRRWVPRLRIDPRGRETQAFIRKLTGISERQLRALSVGTLIYAVMFYIEGFGLLFRRRWAEYMTVITTAGLLPVEGYEVFRRPTAVRFALLIVNALIVVWLIWEIRRTRHSDTAAGASDAVS